MNEGGQSTLEQGERVKIPRLPNKVEKKSGTMVMTCMLSKYLDTVHLTDNQITIFAVTITTRFACNRSPRFGNVRGNTE